MDNDSLSPHAFFSVFLTAYSDPSMFLQSEERTLARTQLFMFLEALDCLLASQPGKP